MFDSSFIIFNWIHTSYFNTLLKELRGPGWFNELGLYELLDPTTYHQYGMGSCPAL